MLYLPPEILPSPLQQQPGETGQGSCKELTWAEPPGSTEQEGTWMPAPCDHLAARQSSAAKDRLGSCLQIWWYKEQFKVLFYKTE